MPTTTPRELLRRQTLLESLSDAEFEALLPHVRFVKAPRKSFVLQKGSRGDTLVMLLSGRLQVIALSEDGQEVGLDFIRPGDFFGELSIIDGEPRSAWVVATVDSLVAHLPKAQAEWLFYHKPAVVQLLLRRLCQMVRNASSNRLMLGANKAFTRVFNVLMSTTRRTGPLTTIEDLPNQTAIAIMANVSRETVSRALQALRDAGVVEKDYRRLIVRDPERLARLARGESELARRDAQATVGHTDPKRAK
jgi:CRP-like cAMP-binding protein